MVPRIPFRAGLAAVEQDPVPGSKQPLAYWLRVCGPCRSGNCLSVTGWNAVPCGAFFVLFSRPMSIGRDCIPMEPPMHFLINGKSFDFELDARVSLLDLFREHMGLTGTKKGCNQGACGACTVLVDGERINACLALAIQYQDRPIITVEGLSQTNHLHPLQQALIEHDGFQCDSIMLFLREGLGNRLSDTVVCAASTKVAAHPLAEFVMVEPNRLGRQVSRDSARHSSLYLVGHADRGAELARRAIIQLCACRRCARGNPAIQLRRPSQVSRQRH